MVDSIRPHKKARRESLRHRLASVTAGATLVLLFIGGLVTTHRAALAVPDWPTTFGYNMFLFPWSEMVGGVFYEHSHRLAASGVGLLTIALAAALWWAERRAWLRWLGAAALLLVVAQGVVGGLRVVLLEETLAILHACLAQAFFGLVVALAIVTSAEWTGSRHALAPDAPRIRRLCLITTGLIYLQTVAGAVLRHTGAGLEIHLFLAVFVALHGFLLGARIWRFPANPPRLRSSAAVLGSLLFLQLALGLGSFWARVDPPAEAWPAIFLTTTHVVVGAALLGAAVALTLRAYCCLDAPEAAAGRRVFARRVPA